MNNILEAIHKVNLPNRTRVQDTSMSVICCGLPRTGTDSLAKALEILGFGPVYHGSMLPTLPGDCAAWAKAHDLRQIHNGKVLNTAFFEKILGNCSAVTDFPGACFSRELLAAYPDAKIVLNVRDVDSWFISMQKALGFYLRGRQYFEVFDTAAFWMRRYTETNFDPMFDRDFDANGKRVYEEHSAMIRRTVPSENLLEWRVEDGWEPLCGFLGKHTPDIAFPRGNSTSEIVPRLEARTGLLKRKAWRYIGILTIAMGASVTAVLASYYRQSPD